MGRIAVFLDGGYVDYVMRDEFAFAKIDYKKLADKMSAGHDLLRTYYYHCLPYQPPNPTPDERRRFSQAQSFFSRLDALSHFAVRQGKLACRGTDASTGKLILEQKRVDLLFGIDLTLLAVKHQITDAALFTGDSDLLPAVEVARAEGVVVHLFHGQKPHMDLRAAADERTLITQDFVNDILFR